MRAIVFIFIVLFTSLLISMNQKENTTRVIAHRGAWKNTGAPENSIASLQQAINLGCYGSEFDVHLSADSVPFILHDNSIQGVYIEKTNAADLKKIRLANGEPLPTLEEYLLAGKGQTKTRLILEIKTSSISKERSLALTKKCVDLVTQTGVTAITDYIAFDFDVCLKAKALSPKASVQYLNGDKSPEELAAAGLDGFDYHFSVLKRNESWLADAHRRNLTTNAWTVNDEETMRWLMDQKIDMITTNEPEKLLKLLN
ncbi:MAG: glycerophosphodiester phosphodiesterase [Cyclobacteriaceae bacterium]|jgi:glycerophosphoryl diester phosphodiesterase|nr:glycerophosphodiester phosphodiesterase [Cyclobacteriaceae bacterium]